MVAADKKAMGAMRQLCLFLLVALLAGCGAQKQAAVPTGATVLVLGDSISYGTGADTGEDYPHLLAGDTGWRIINAGVPGDTSADGLARLPALLDQHAPRLLLVELGGNDFLKHLPRAETAANLEAILTLSRKRGIPAVLLGIPRPNLFGAAVGRLGDDPIFEEIASDTNTPLIGGVVGDVLSSRELKSDPVHPNAAGYRRLAAGLREALKGLGFLR